MPPEPAELPTPALVRATTEVGPGPGPRPAAVDLRLALPAVGGWATTGLVTGVESGPAAAVAVGLVSATVGTALLWRVVRRPSWRRQVAVLLLVLAVAAVCACLGAHRARVLADHPLTRAVGMRCGVEVTVRAPAHPIRGGGVLLPVAVGQVCHRPAPRGLATVVLARGSSWSGLAQGQRLAASVEVLEPRAAGETPALRALGGPRPLGSAPAAGRFASRVREGAATASRHALGPRWGPMLVSMVLGDERAVPEELRETLTGAGLAHLSAVSGANVVFVVGFALVLATTLGCGRRARPVVAGLALAGFVAVVGPEPAVLRAAGTGAIGLAALAGERGRRPTAALATVVLCVCLLDPGTATGVGFGLSVAATVALVAAAAPASSLLRRARLPRVVADVVAVCVVAHLATAPVAWAAGLRQGPWALVANLLVAPAVPVVTVVGTLAAAVAPWWPWPAETAMRLAGPALWWIDRVAGALGSG